MKTFLVKYLRPAVVLTLILTIVTGFLYPGIVTAIGQLLFNHQANGSLITASNGQVIGSELIGQYWTLPQYFHGRPSAAVDVLPDGTAVPYAADNSSASNLGPTSAALKQDVQQRIAALQAEFTKENLPVPTRPRAH